MANTYENIVAKIRELSFDRFVTPTFFVRARGGATDVSIQIFADKFRVTKTAVNTDYLYSTYDTLDKLIGALMNNANVEAIYAGSFLPSEPVTSLLVKPSTSVTNFVPIFRAYYFSTAWLEKWFREYLREVMCKPESVFADADTADFTEAFASEIEFTYFRELHFCLWIAYQLVNDRRLYELASQQLIQSTLGGNPDQMQDLSSVDVSSFSLMGPGNDLQVNIGEVYTLSEDKNTNLGLYNSGEIPKDMVPPWGVGSDNVLMDYYSFWYRLQLWIRSRLEETTGDYSLRRDTVLNGRVDIDPRNSNKWFAYFDSYPWVFSPYARGITNGDPMNLRT